jgi:hypothetical protein
MRRCHLKKPHNSFKVIKNSKQIPSTESFLKTLVHLFCVFLENHSFLFYWGVSRLFGHTVLADCSTVTRTGTLRCDTNPLNIDVNEILEIQNTENCKLYSGIRSTSVAFLAGYIALTIEERVECEICLNTVQPR